MAGGSLLELRLARFGRVLRALGVPVGSGELVDALGALRVVDPLDRHQAKLALSAAMAKDQRSRELFDLAFDRFFTSGTSPAAGEPDQYTSDGADAGPDGDAHRQQPPQLWGEQLRLTPEQLSAWEALSEAQRERLREFLRRAGGEGGLDDSYRPLVEHVVREHLDRWHPAPPAHGLGGAATGDETLDEIVAGVIAGSGAEFDPLLSLDMNSIPAGEVARAGRVIRRLARRLATRMMRRYRVARRAASLDFRRTMRANFRYGGVPLRLHYRSPRISKPRIVLVCDVSGSMKKHAVFTLYFAGALYRTVQDLEGFVFAEDLERITPQLRGSTPRQLQQLAQDSAVWGRGTNLGRALRQLLSDHRTRLTPRTTVLILSDTKTLAAREAADLLREIRERVREVLWLNTVPEEQWGTLAAVELFQQHATMYPCSSLGDLGRVLDRAILRHRL